METAKPLAALGLILVMTTAPGYEPTSERDVMTTSPTAQPGIMDIALYQSGQSEIDGMSEVLKLSSNENPFGPSEKAKVAFSSAARQLHRYPSTDHLSLRMAIADVHGLNADQIICGAGSDEIITFLCQAYAGPGDEVIHTAHGFSMYRISTLAAGATPVEVPERDRTVDVEEILAGVTDKTRLVFVANPANPTSTMVGGNELTRLAGGLPDNVILVLDGAYAEFADGYDGGVALVESRENVVMTRTFSKLYGLGGLRVGWGYGPQNVIDVLNRVRGPFNLGQAQLDAAEAAVRDQDYAQTCRDVNAKMRVWLADALTALGIPSDPSHANFILARFEGAAEASACETHLRGDGILVRKTGGYKLPECLRITVGDEAACRRVVASVRTFKEASQ
jgi:histidinol-phosphate aminotransferase